MYSKENEIFAKIRALNPLFTDVQARSLKVIVTYRERDDETVASYIDY